MPRPNTIEEWYPDALRFLRGRYKYLPDVELDYVLARFAIYVAVGYHKFNPNNPRCSAFQWLCWRARASAAYEKKWRGKDLMRQGIRISPLSPAEAERLEAALALVVAARGLT